MKKYFFFAAAAIVAVSCAKTPAPVQTPDGPEAPAVEGKVAVQFGTNISANVETKAVGSVDSWATSQNLYVYGFARVKDADSGTITWGFGDNQTTFPFINNVAASAPDGGPSGSINVEKDVDNHTPFYYQNTTTYDFFGYYVDDAAGDTPSPELRDGDSFVLPITINGGQDIMLASASVDDAVKAAKGENATEWENKNQNWNNQYAFSAYAARRGVHPILKFEHQLTQIQLYVQSGTDFTSNPALTIKSAEFQGVNTTADLCIAVQKESQKTRGVVNEAKGSGSIFVTEASSSTDPVNLTRKPLSELTLDSTNGSAAQKLGACTMLFPAASYLVDLTLSQEGAEQHLPITLKIGDVLDENEKKPGDEGYNPTKPEKFEKGYRYDVYVTVYGLEKVKVTVVLSEWAEGGKIDINTDKAPEF